MPFVTDKEGNTRRVSADEIQQSLAKKEWWTGAEGLSVNLVSPDGTVQGVGFNPQDVQESLAAGYRFENEDEEYKRWQSVEYDSPWLAGILGAARGATFGLSDKLLVDTGALDHNELGAYRDENESASFWGEMGGAVGPILASGGTAAPGVLAKATATGVARAAMPKIAKGVAQKIFSKAPTAFVAKQARNLELALMKRAATGTTAMGRGLGRAGARAVSYGAEGGIYGAGMAWSEGVMRGEPLSAEEALAFIGVGTIMGGVAGAALPAAGELLFGEAAFVSGTRSIAGKEVNETQLYKILAQEHGAQKATKMIDEGKWLQNYTPKQLKETPLYRVIRGSGKTDDEAMKLLKDGNFEEILGAAEKWFGDEVGAFGRGIEAATTGVSRQEGRFSPGVIRGADAFAEGGELFTESYGAMLPHDQQKVQQLYRLQEMLEAENSYFRAAGHSTDDVLKFYKTGDVNLLREPGYLTVPDITPARGTAAHFGPKQSPEVIWNELFLADKAGVSRPVLEGRLHELEGIIRGAPDVAEMASKDLNYMEGLVEIISHRLGYPGEEVVKKWPGLFAKLGVADKVRRGFVAGVAAVSGKDKRVIDEFLTNQRKLRGAVDWEKNLPRYMENIEDMRNVARQHGQMLEEFQQRILGTGPPAGQKVQRALYDKIGQVRSKIETLNDSLFAATERAGKLTPAMHAERDTAARELAGYYNQIDAAFESAFDAATGANKAELFQAIAHDSNAVAIKARLQELFGSGVRIVRNEFGEIVQPATGPRPTGLLSEADEIIRLAKEGDYGFSKFWKDFSRAVLKAQRKINEDPKAGSMFIEVDVLKRDVGKAIRKMSRKRDLLAGEAESLEKAKQIYFRLRNPLEDAELFGEAAAKAQKEVNELWTRYLADAARRPDHRFSQSWSTEGWVRKTKADPAGFRKYVDDLGGIKNDLDEPWLMGQLSAQENLIRSISEQYQVSGAQKKIIDDGLEALNKFRMVHDTAKKGVSERAATRQPFTPEDMLSPENWEGMVKAASDFRQDFAELRILQQQASVYASPLPRGFRRLQADTTRNLENTLSLTEEMSKRASGEAQAFQALEGLRRTPAQKTAAGLGALQAMMPGGRAGLAGAAGYAVGGPGGAALGAVAGALASPYQVVKAINAAAVGYRRIVDNKIARLITGKLHVAGKAAPGPLAGQIAWANMYESSREKARLKKIKEPSERFAEMIDTLETMSNPETFMTIIDQKLGDVGRFAGMTQTQMSGVIQKAVTYLLETAPSGAPTGLDALTGNTPEIPQSELNKWLRRVDIVYQPDVVLDRMRTGMLTPEESETIETVYPELHTYIITQAMGEIQKMAKAGKIIPHRLKNMMWYLGGIKLDGAYNLGARAQLEAQAEQGAGAGPGAAPPGKKSTRTKSGKMTQKTKDRIVNRQLSAFDRVGERV